jgi:hypothetical protein
MSSNRPETDGELPFSIPPQPKRVVITCFYSNDPRERRVVVTERGAHPVEVCDRDALGHPSWRVEKDPPAAVRLETLLARALLVDGRTDGRTTIVLGKIAP